MEPKKEDMYVKYSYKFQISLKREIAGITSTMSQFFEGIDSCCAKEKAKEALPLWEITSCVCVG